MDSLLTLAGVAVAGYLIYEYMQGSGSAPIVQSTGPGQFGLAPTSNNSPTADTSWRAATPTTSFAAGAVNPGYFGGGGHAEQQGASSYRAPARDYAYSDVQVDTSQYKPQAIDTNPVYNPPVQDVWTSSQRDYFSRCTFIDGTVKPGCV